MEEENFNLKEVRHLAVNFAITSLNGYDGSFDEWYKNISPQWREIANRKTKGEIRKGKIKKLLKKD
jgi:hypothetical protein